MDSYLTSEVSRLATSGHQRVRAEAKVWRDENQWHVALITLHDGERGERIIDAETCALAADATSLVLAMMIDPEGVRARLASTEAPPASSAAAPIAKDEPAKPASQAATPGRDRFVLSLLGALDASALPSPAPGIGAAASVRILPLKPTTEDRWRFQLEGFGFFFSSQRASASAPGRGGDLSLWTGGLRAIPTIALHPVILGPTAGFELGSLGGDGFGVKNIDRASSLWSAFLVGAIARWPSRGPFGLRAQAELVVPVTRSEFHVANETVHATPSLSVRGALGAEVRF